MAEVVARGVRFHVQRLGDHGPPTVMLHGMLIGNLATWYFTAAPAVARRGRRVLLFDLRGHGRTERVAEGYDVASMAGDLDALATPFAGDAKLSLVGHSWGALVALRFALDHPQRVARLVLVDAPLPPGSYEEARSFLQQTPEAMADALPGPLRDAAVGGRRAMRRLIAQLRFLAEEARVLDVIAAEPDVSDAELATLACPTLCIYGERSACLPVGHRLARVIPDARLLVLPAGHYLTVETPEALTAGVVDFLEERADG